VDGKLFSTFLGEGAFAQYLHQGISETDVRCLVEGWRLGVMGRLAIAEPVASPGDSEPSNK